MKPYKIILHAFKHSEFGAIAYKTVAFCVIAECDTIAEANDVLCTAHHSIQTRQFEENNTLVARMVKAIDEQYGPCLYKITVSDVIQIPTLLPENEKIAKLYPPM
jgi:hypothetical protein